jgi:hypothetical protein
MECPPACTLLATARRRNPRLEWLERQCRSYRRQQGLGNRWLAGHGVAALLLGAAEAGFVKVEDRQVHVEDLRNRVPILDQVWNGLALSP